MQPLLLDLFCGPGGAGKGYSQAGFEVVGVDISAQPRYPFEFYQEDALEFFEKHEHEFDVIHASPPCQRFSMASLVHRNNGKEYPDYLSPTREKFEQRGGIWIIENVQCAPMKPYTLMLCGLMFGLKVFRHRLFQISHLIFPPHHPSHKGKRIGEGYFSIAGGAGRWKNWGTVKRNVSKGTAAEWRDAMGIDWMIRSELTQAIPPPYTEWIGKQILKEIYEGKTPKNIRANCQKSSLLPAEA